MRVLFDGFWWVEGPFSNRQVQRELILAWADRFPEDELGLAVPRAHLEKARDDAPAGTDLFGCRLRPHGVAAALEMARLAKRFRADVTITHNFAPVTGRSAIFLHDVLFQSNPEWFTRSERLYYGGMPLLAPRAEVVFSSSVTEAQRIRGYNRRIRRVVPIGLSVSTELAEASPEAVSALTDADFLLCVARLNVRKNLAVAVEAGLQSGQLSPRRPFVIVGEDEGKTASLSDAVGNAIADGRVRLLSRVTSGQLAWLYQRARAFVFPSLDEGFGLPPIEALHFGCPVIAADIPVLRETLGPYAAYADPHDVAEFSSRIVDTYASAPVRIAVPPDYLNTWRRSVEAMREALAR